MSAERNKARALELIERVTNGHDLAALEEFTSNSGASLRSANRRRLRTESTQSENVVEG